MANNLVIVESPAKAKTINKYLGSSYKVVASNGHVRDLPKSTLGIDIEHDYEPKYITIRGKGELLAALRKEVKKADKIYLATDPDREGEAISWHLIKALRLDEIGKPVSRITFNEITKEAIKTSLKHARQVDMNLVDSQQARRMLDRMVGYSISPLLWAKVKRGLSAGRVQSATLGIIEAREKEIDSFIPEEFWSLDAILKVDNEKKPLIAKFYKTPKGKKDIKSEKKANEIEEAVKNADFKITDIKVSEKVRKSPFPFTTSTMQQEASKQLNMSTAATMRTAQQLYEGVNVHGHGTVALITYLRTDSTRVSESADLAAKNYIKDTYGEQFVIKESKKAAAKSNIQDAHEAIRPTYMNLPPVKVKESLTRDQFRLYQLIWNRFVASRMADAKYEMTSVKIDADGYEFRTTGNKITFQGFLSVYKQTDEDIELGTIPAKLNAGSKLSLNEIDKKQHFTQPPAHFTEASLVKALEELGIGRPSTYAPTISTLLNRHYIAKEKKNIYMTDLGDIVDSIMQDAFPTIVDVEFTANMESLLDSVEEGTVNYKTVIENFYPDLMEAVNEAESNLDKVEIEDEVSDVQCDVCGRMMVIKFGPHGKFLACPGFPECRNTKTYFEKVGVSCPKCGKDIVVRKTKKGRRYYGCEDIPNCDFMVWSKPSDKKCPKCGQLMTKKGSKLVCMDEKCGYVEK